MRCASISRLGRVLLAAASGILLGLSFPTARLWPLVFVALVPLLVVLERGTPPAGDPRPTPRDVRWAPWIAGATFYVFLFWWILRLPASAMTVPWLIGPGLAAIGLYLGLFVALFGWIVRFARRRAGIPVLLMAPFAWVAVEWVKSSGPLGCPWGNLAYALAAEPAWIQGASIGGTSGLGLWIAAVNAAIAGAVVTRAIVTRVALVLLAASFVLLPPLWGASRLRGSTVVPLIRVALIQPNIGSEEKWNPVVQDSIVAILEALTREAAAHDPKPDLIVWPETALPFYVRLEPGKERRMRELAVSAGSPILAGYPNAKLTTDGGIVTHNAAGLFLPTGTLGREYAKMHLVPFGERIPFQEVFPFLGGLDLGQAEWTPGTEPVVFVGAGARLGVLICFESIFPDHARTYVGRGAQFLVNITNDEWFGLSAGPVQHAEMAIMRSVELGVGLARCANTGISMIVDPWGRVRERTGLFERRVVVADVPSRLAETPFARRGDVASVGGAGLVLFVCLIAWFRPRATIEPGTHAGSAPPSA